MNVFMYLYIWYIGRPPIPLLASLKQLSFRLKEKENDRLVLGLTAFITSIFTNNNPNNFKSTLSNKYLKLKDSTNNNSKDSFDIDALKKYIHSLPILVEGKFSLDQFVSVLDFVKNNFGSVMIDVNSLYQFVDIHGMGWIR